MGSTGRMVMDVIEELLRRVPYRREDATLDHFPELLRITNDLVESLKHGPVDPRLPQECLSIVVQALPDPRDDMKSQLVMIGQEIICDPIYSDLPTVVFASPPESIALGDLGED